MRKNKVKKKEPYPGYNMGCRGCIPADVPCHVSKECKRERREAKKKQLKSEKPDLPILILSMHPEEQYALRVLKAGASGYLTKDCASDEVIAAIRKVSEGKKYITSTIAERLAFDLETNIKGKPHESLSDRELQVMCMIAAGKTVKEIAEELSLSVKTISTYRYRILIKMKVNNNAELIRYAITNRLVS